MSNLTSARPTHNKKPCARLSALILIASFLSLSFNLAAQDKDLELQTEPSVTKIPLTGDVKITSEGTVLATPVDPTVCQATSSCDGVQVNLSSFTANDEQSLLSIDQGTTVYFEWESRGAWSCETLGNLPGWDAGELKPTRATGLQQSVSTNSLEAGEYTAGLICANGSVTSSSNVITVDLAESSSPPPDPTSCPSNRQPPPGWARVTTCLYNSSADCTDFGAIFGGDGTVTTVNTGNIRNVVLNEDSDQEYIAMRLTTQGLSPTTSRQVQIEGPQNPIGNYGGGGKMVTISTCPGDFNKNEIINDSGCYFEGSSFINDGLISIGSLTVGGTSSTASCKLESDQTYYLNILYTSSPAGTSPENIQPSSCADGKSGCGNQWVVQ
ncbi:hypothetical protein [Wenzhouxiangella limi]|uniref:Ig-like domain-containing protein n=1 Tax=Wenzhouxiangella limi TaxID=2707351 RepID=A0A845V4U2_9GAMM|nr:hypothetical protein [Wenzhouxiangella limi]NDY94975.1 hypothetical protein [Wenzhouxiangella limi]